MTRVETERLPVLETMCIDPLHPLLILIIVKTVLATVFVTDPRSGLPSRVYELLLGFLFKPTPVWVLGVATRLPLLPGRYCRSSTY
jgi:hypothetical protein